MVDIFLLTLHSPLRVSHLTLDSIELCILRCDHLVELPVKLFLHSGAIC